MILRAFLNVFLFSIFSLSVFSQTEELKKEFTNYKSSKTISFEENLGQVANSKGSPVKEVLFTVTQPNLKLFITEWGLTYYILHEAKTNQKDTNKNNIGWERIDMVLENAKISSGSVMKEKEVNGYKNFFYPHCPDGITNVKSYQKITFINVYPNIDWVLYTNDGKELKYDFVVKPGGDPAAIKFNYLGVDELFASINNSSITVKGRTSSIADAKLIGYSGEEKVSMSFNQTKRNHFSFNVLDNYDKSKNLIIDPILTWSTFYGTPSSTNGDNGFDVALNGTHVFVGGGTNSTTFPLQNPGGGAYYQSAYGGGTGAAGDIFVAKLTHTGTNVWTTYYGGSLNESAYSIALENNLLVIGGYTFSNNLPTSNPGGGAFFQGTKGTSGTDGYLVAFNTSGVREWATYYGGNGSDGVEDVRVIGANIYAVGHTSSTNLLMQNPGGGAYFQGTLSGGSGQDGFILKFSNTSKASSWRTYYGGTGSETFNSIDGSLTDDVFITGTTSSTNFPVLNPGGGAYYQGSLAGGADLFMLKLDYVSNNRIWSTYLGGTGNEQVASLVMNSSDVFVTSTTSSTNYPTLNPGGGAYFQAANGGSGDAIITRFNNNGVMNWSTYYGGSGNELFGLNGGKIATSGASVYVTFRAGANCPVLGQIGSYNRASGSGQEGFLVEFNSVTNNRTWASYFGAGSTDVIWGIAANNNYLYATGVTTSSSGFPLVDLGGGAYYDGTFSAFNQAFFSQFTLCAPETNTTSNAAICENQTKSLTSSGAGGGTWSVQSGGGTISGTTYTPANVASNTSVTIRYTDLCGNNSDVTFTVNSELTVSNTTTTTAICENQNKTLVGSPAGGTWTVQSGGGTISGTTYTPVNVTSNTTVVVRYTGAANGACVADFADVTFTVNVNNVAVNSTTTTSICETSTKPLVGSPAGGTWSVQSGGGTISGTTYTPANITSNTSVTVRYSIAANGGCPATTSDATFTVTPTITPSITSSNASMCSGDTRALVASPAGGTWTIVSGPGTISGSTLTATGSGTIQLRYRIVNACGNNDATQSITVSNTVAAVITSSSASLCGNLTRTLTATPTGGTWSIVSGPGLLTGAVLSSTGTGVIRVAYAVTASCGSGNDTVDITVNPVPVASTSGNETICITDSVTLTASGGNSYSWTPGGFTSASIRVSPAITSTYRVNVISDSGCIAIDSSIVTVQTPNSVNALNDRATVTSEQIANINVFVNDTGDVSTINIISGSFNGSSSVTNGIVTYQSNVGFVGLDSIFYELCDANCQVVCDTAILTFTVEKEIVIPQFISPNNDGFNDVWFIEGLSKYPNPSVKIFNRWGSIVFETNSYQNAWDGTSNNEVISGTYFYVLELDETTEPVTGYIQVRD